MQLSPLLRLSLAVSKIQYSVYQTSHAIALFHLFANHIDSLHLATANQPSNSNVAVVNNDDLRKMRADIDGKSTTKSNANREAAIVTQADIARMRAAAVVISEKDAA